MTTHLDDPNYRYSINTYADVDGTQNTFEVSFALGYISKTQVSVRVTGPDGITYTPTVTWNGANTVQLSPTPLAHSTVKIFRNTDISKAVLAYSDGDMISEANLDLSSKQLIMAMQETADAFGVVPNRTELAEALAHADSAITQAEAATTTANNASAAATSASAAATSATNAANAVVASNTVALAGKLNKAGDTASGPIHTTTSARWLETVWRNNYGSVTQLASAQLTAANENGTYVGTLGIEMYPDGGSAFVVALSPAGSRTTDRRQSALAVYPDQMYFLSNVVWHAGNDGHNSGMDADTVDGVHLSGLLRANVDAGITSEDGRTRFWFSSNGDTAICGRYVVFHDPSGAELAGIDPAGTLRVHGAVIDGSGANLSNRDALTLSGHSYSEFDRVTASSIGATGYRVMADGSKEVWMNLAISQDSYSYGTFPITFDSPPVVVFPTIDNVSTGASENTLLVARTNTGFTVWQAANTGGSLPVYVRGK